MNSETKPASHWLVTTQWLQDHLDAPDIVVVDGSYFLSTMKRNAREEYLTAHIPGAVFLDIDEVRRPHQRPAAYDADSRRLSSAMRHLGIGDGQTIVVYDGIGLFSAPRRMVDVPCVWCAGRVHP